MIDRKKFFDDIRTEFPGDRLTQDQVDGMNRILDYAEKNYPHWDLAWLAYALATTKIETAHTMQPIRERDNKAGTYLRSKKYWPFYGRGLAQLTWGYNYAKYGIKDNPDKALEWPTALHILFHGMENGVFTGKKLSDYFNKDKMDWKGARRIINGQDRAAEIGELGKKFYAALGAKDMNPLIPLLVNAVTNGVQMAARNPNVPEVQPSQAPAITAAVEAAAASDPKIAQAGAAVEQALTPIPWYRSPVILGQVVAGVSLAVGLFAGVKIDEAMQGDITQILVFGGNAVGIAITVIGRITSKAQPVTLK